MQSGQPRLSPALARRIYAKQPDLPYVSLSPAARVRVVTALGGAGMTLSFGLAEQTIRELVERG